MELFFIALVCLGFFLAGYIVGLMQNGIKIIHKEDHHIPEEYNPTITDNLTPEVKEYFDKMYGNIGG